MRRSHKSFVGAVVLAVLSSAGASAQTQTPSKSANVATPDGEWLWGGSFGHTYSTFQLPLSEVYMGRGPQVTSAAGTSDGGFASLDLQMPLGRVFYLQSGLAVAARGAYMIVQSGLNEVDFGETLTYIDIPLLLGARIGPSLPVHPYLSAGPVLGIFAGCQVLKSKCSDLTVNSTDYGAQIGAGLEFGRLGSGSMIVVGADYYSGFANVFPDGTKNSSYEITVSYRRTFGHKGN